MASLRGSRTVRDGFATSRRPTHLGSLILLAVGVFFAICTEMLPVGLLPDIGAGLGVSDARTGLLVSLYAVLVAVASVPIAGIAERWPRRSVITVLLAVYAVSNLIFGIAPGYPVAIVARAIGGLAHAGFFSVAIAAAVALVDAAHSGRALAFVMIGNALALVFGVPVGTLLGGAFGWRWAFLLLAAVLAVLAVAVFRVLPAQPAPRATPGGSVWAGVRKPAVILVAVVVILLALGHFTLYTYVTPLLLHDGVSHSSVGAVLFGYGCGGLAGLAVGAAVVNRWSSAALAADIVLMGVCLAAAAAVASTFGIVTVVVVWGMAFGAFPTLTQMVMLRAAGDATGAATALTNATTNVGIAGGALLGSQLLDVVAVPGLGWVGAGLVAVSLLLYATRLRPGSAAA